MIESAATGVEQLRPRRNRLRRRSRRALYGVGFSALAAGVLAAVSALLIVGPLSAYPATTYGSDTSIRLDDGTLTVDLPVGKSWTRLGVLPPSDEAELVSPDGRYSLEVQLLPAHASSQEALDAAADASEDGATASFWKSERSTTGVVARHREVVDGDWTKTVIGITRPDGTALVLTARTLTTDADRYRALTASIVGSLGQTP